jgi:hypothetical protein
MKLAINIGHWMVSRLGPKIFFRICGNSKKFPPLWVSLAVAGLLCTGTPFLLAAEEEVVTESSTSNAPSTNAPTGTTSSTGEPQPAAPPPGATTANTPSGTGLFSKSPVQLSLSVLEGYDDNVNTAPSNAQSSSYTSGNATLEYDFGTPRLQFGLAAAAGGTYYNQHLANQNYDIDLHGSSVLQYKASPRLTLGAEVLLAYLTEPSFNFGVGLDTRSGNYFYTSDKFSVTYAWTRRFSTLTRYTVSFINYDSQTIGVFQDRVENTFGNEFRFLLVPTTTLVAEYRFGIVDYKDAPLNSKTHFILAGFDHTFNPRLLATVRGGAEFRSYDQDGNRNGPYFEGNLTYALGRRTSLSWTNRYGIEEPDVTNTQSRTVFRTGLEGKMSLAPRLSTTAGIYYVHSDYHQPSAKEDDVDFALGFRYSITHYIGVQVGYHYTDVNANVAGRDYDRNRAFGGLNVTF